MFRPACHPNAKIIIHRWGAEVLSFRCFGWLLRLHESESATLLGIFTCWVGYTGRERYTLMTISGCSETQCRTF